MGDGAVYIRPSSTHSFGIFYPSLSFPAFDLECDRIAIMSFDTEVLIIGAGMSGLGLAVQMIRRFGVRNFELIEKSNDVGGTWLANTYPGCGCDVSK